MVQEEGRPPRILSGDASPRTGTLGSADLDIDPAGEECAYVDRRGRLVAVSLGGGRARVLVSEGASVPRYSPDGRLVAAVVTRLGGPAVAVVDRARPDWPVPLTPSLGLVPVDLDWSPDGRRLVVSFVHPEQMPWDSGEIWLASLDGAPRRLVAATAGRHTGSARFLDSSSVFYTSDRDGWLNLWRVGLGDGRSEPLVAEAREHLYPSVSPDGSRVAFVSRRAGDARLFVLELAGGKLTDVHPEPGLHGTWFFAPSERVAWWPDSRRLVVAFSSPRYPPRLGCFDSDGRGVTWLTDHGLPSEISDLFAPPAELTWERDGLSVHGWVRAPATLEAGEKPPLAVHVHGGPVGDAALWWYAPIAHLVAAGWCVLDVNYRGSVGFGRAYLDALCGRWGKAEVEDLAAGVMAARREVDLWERTAIFGVSAGAFSTVASLIAHPGLYRAGVAGCGVYDLTTLSEETVPAQAWYLTRLLGPQSEHFDRYVDHSPLHHAARLRRPVLIWHGTAATATPLAQSQRLAAALASAGCPHELRIYEGEGYGGVRVETTKAQLNEALAFLVRTVIDR